MTIIELAVKNKIEVKVQKNREKKRRRNSRGERLEEKN